MSSKKSDRLNFPPSFFSFFSLIFFFFLFSTCSSFSCNSVHQTFIWYQCWNYLLLWIKKLVNCCHKYFPPSSNCIGAIHRNNETLNIPNMHWHRRQKISCSQFLFNMKTTHRENRCVLKGDIAFCHKVTMKYYIFVTILRLKYLAFSRNIMTIKICLQTAHFEFHSWGTKQLSWHCKSLIVILVNRPIGNTASFYG